MTRFFLFAAVGGLCGLGLLFDQQGHVLLAKAKCAPAR
jgi:hypothetical protein